MIPKRLRIVLASGVMILSIALFLPGRLEAACTQSSQQVAQLLGTWFENCADNSPVGGFIALISDPAGVNSNGTDAVCESSTAPDGLGRTCPPESGTRGDGQVVVQYDFGPDNWFGSLGCPMGNLQGGSPMIVQVVANDGSSAIVRTSYDSFSGGYLVDLASPYDEATGVFSPLPCRLPYDQSVRFDHLAPSEGGAGYEVDLTVLLPTLESDCNQGTAGSTIPQCTNGVADNPVVTRGRLFTRVASCYNVSELRTSAWTLSAVQPDGDGHAHLSLPVPSSGCLYIGTTYAYDGVEVPAIAGFQELPKACIPESLDCPGYRTIRIDVADPSIVWWAPEWWVDSYNVYRGDLAVLKQTGVYTQDPATVPLAARSCDLASDAARDDVELAPGQGAFYLVSGNYVNYGTHEGPLGTNSAGGLRPNTNPCH